MGAAVLFQVDGFAKALVTFGTGEGALARMDASMSNEVIRAAKAVATFGTSKRALACVSASMGNEVR